MSPIAGGDYGNDGLELRNELCGGISEGGEAVVVDVGGPLEVEAFLDKLWVYVFWRRNGYFVI